MIGTPHVLMIFLDGVGIGKKDAHVNPFFAANLPTLQKLFNGSMIHLRDGQRSNSIASTVPLNTTLGITGLPQSGTGQAALLTGVNAPRIVGKHFGPYLYSSLKPVVAERNLFAQLRACGRYVFYANAFPRQYFEHLRSMNPRTTAISYAWMVGGFQLNDSTALFAGRSISADLTNERWHTLGYPDLRTIAPHEAGRRLARFAREYDLVLFEYFYTDHAGHSQSMSEAVAVLERLDCLLEGILDAFDHDSMLLLIVSDHGNLEDLSSKSHTRNPVPFVAYGKHHRRVTARVSTLMHVAPAIVRLYK